MRNWPTGYWLFCQRQSDIEDDAECKDERSKVLATRPKPRQKQRQRPKAKASAKAKTKGTSLAHDFVRERGEDSLEVGKIVSLEPEYNPGSRLWVTRWWTAAGEIQEDSVKVVFSCDERQLCENSLNERPLILGVKTYLKVWTINSCQLAMGGPDR